MQALATISLFAVVHAAAFGVNGSNGGAVHLVIDGRPTAVLVLPAEAHPDEQLAAREIQTHVEKMSGAKLPIVSAEGPSDAIAVRIGLVLNREAEAKIRTAGSDPAAFVILVEPDEVTLAGLSPEGTLFAAYELLEQLGCRWYLPGDLGAVIPSRKTIAVPLGKTVQGPSFPHRHLQGVSKLLPWYRRQRLGGLYFPGSHGIGLSPRADFTREPELFALVKGQRIKRQLCISNPEVLKRAIAATMKFFDRHPESPWIGMGPRDGSGFCECENCRKLDAGEWDPFAGEPSMTDRYVWFFNKVLEAVHKKHPGKKICFYAYHTYKLPPRKVKPSRFIVPALAPITLCRIHGMSNPICPERSFYKTLMTEWSKLVPEVFERGYYFNLACPGFPFSKIHAVRDETVMAYKLGVKGWRVECMPAWASHGPTLYVAPRLMWNVNADVDALLSEFYQEFFGPASGPMGEYLENIDRWYRDTDCHSGGSYCMPVVFTAERMTELGRLLDKAASSASGDQTFAERVRIFRLSYDHLAAFLTMLESRNQLDFATAHKWLERLKSIQKIMLDYKLIEVPAPRKQIVRATLLWPRAANRYLDRFWIPCTESGYERTVLKGDLVAAAPDEWDYLIDPSRIGEQLGWARDGRVGGNWQRTRTRMMTRSDRGLRYYRGPTWYRTSVTIGERFRGRKLYLWIGVTDESTRVWVNGIDLGDCSSAPPEGFTLPGRPKRKDRGPVDVEATKAVRFGKPNTIVVKGDFTGPVMFWSPRSE